MSTRSPFDSPAWLTISAGTHVGHRPQDPIVGSLGDGCEHARATVDGDMRTSWCRSRSPVRRRQSSADSGWSKCRAPALPIACEVLQQGFFMPYQGSTLSICRRKPTPDGCGTSPDELTGVGNVSGWSGAGAWCVGRRRCIGSALMLSPFPWCDNGDAHGDARDCHHHGCESENRPRTIGTRCVCTVPSS